MGRCREAYSGGRGQCLGKVDIANILHWEHWAIDWIFYEIDNRGKGVHVRSGWGFSSSDT